MGSMAPGALARYLSPMAPRTTLAQPARFRVAPEDEADMAEASAEAERGEGIELTPEQLRRWVETGEWPADA